jgi:FtsP/CotA-like multicopper oxidase with cupredoxin domain
MPNRRVVLAAMAASALQVPVAFGGVQTLRVATRTLDVKGRAATVFGIEGWRSLDLSYGTVFEVAIENSLNEATLLHWHGLTPPIAMDGVPMLSGPALAAGETRKFSFTNTRTGTHWVHSHVGLQEQKLLAAPLVVRETGEPLVEEQEHVVLLHDFTFREPAEILAELQAGGGGHAMHGGAMKMDHSAGSKMAAMSNDISYDAMLANDRTLDDPEVVRAEKGGRFRLRIINGAASSNQWIDLGELEGELIAVDGTAVHPVRGTRFPLAVAQRADIRLVLPPGSGAWPILFQAESAVLRSGIILQSGDGGIAKLSDQGEPGDALGLELEASLKTLITLPDEPVTRTEVVMLTGGDAGYVWGLNGKASMHDILFSVREGERIELMFHNMTGMAHPMHLHGHYFKVVAIDGIRVDGAVRDTVLVPVGQSVTVRFDADNPGTWALHCHHLYHMNSGMMGAMAYTGAA